MSQDIIVSIIIPVYLVEKHLSFCIESVLKQSYPYKEIILVDDGSPDLSPILCDNYAKQYPNIRAIHKQNGGLSDARNVGVSYASGDYILFLDSDDFWDSSDALETLIQRIKQTEADVVNFSFAKYYESSGKIETYFFNVPNMPINITTKREQLDYIAKKNLYLSSAWSKIVKRELFLNHNLQFEVGAYSEDIEWSARLLEVARSMDFLCANFYCYRQHSNSISHTINDKKCHDLCRHLVNCIEMTENCSEDVKVALSNYTAYQFGTFFIVQAQAENFQKDCIETLNKYQTILKYHKGNPKLTFLYWGCKVLGYKNLCRLIRFIFRINQKK